MERTSTDSDLPGPNFDHDPVMLREITDLASNLSPGVFVDLTLGGAGHSFSVLSAHPSLVLHAVDQDERAIVAATEQLAPFGDRANIHHTRFDNANSVLDSAGVTSISGFLMDLGVSSPQIDTSERGFSYRLDGPLDMRMDPSTTLTAADVVNTYSPAELLDVLRSYGDERQARRVVDAIVANRPIESTVALAELVSEAMPAAVRRKSTGHLAKRTFQAIRIEVNDELGILGDTLDAMIERLAPGGVGMVLTYHSGEDRITKDRMRQMIDGDAPPGMPSMSPFSWLFRGARTPSDEEIASNPRARSARLRAITRADT